MDPNDDRNDDAFFEYLPADHPKNRPMQEAMQAQLKKEEDSLRLELKEKTEELKKIKRLREDVGVNLYSFQQQYAKIQDQLDEAKNTLRGLERHREESENTLSNVESLYQERKSAIAALRKNFFEANEELNRLNWTIKNVEEYNQQVESKIKQTTTTAYVVEKKMTELEKDKKEQDFLISYLMEQINTLMEKKLLYEAQLKSQKEETEISKENLKEANTEIITIQERKRNLLKDWDKSLISMRNIDKSLLSVRENITEQEGEKQKLTSQLRRYIELITKEKQNFTELVELLNSKNAKEEQIKHKIEVTKEATDRLNDELNLLKRAAESTKDEIRKENLKETAIKNDKEIINKDRLKLNEESRTFYEKNMVVLSSKETHDKQVENILKQNAHLEKDILELEVEVNVRENEIVRVEIDKLNVQDQNEQLEKRLRQMVSEISKLEKDHDDKLKDIKNNHESLVQKQLNVDKLNKKYSKLTNNKGGEDEGELEKQIKELETKLANLNKAIQDNEEEWINKKRDLVKKEYVLNNLSEENLEKRSKKTILEHKKLRLKTSYELQEKEIREIEINLKNLRNDMIKYNTLLYENQEVRNKLQHQFQDVKTEFLEKLKLMENETTRMELEIEALRQEKAETLTAILEIERQIQLWERKITLEENMQEIIKPNKGMKEIDEMKKEIHVQELTYKKLRNEQEKVMKNMQMAIQRRDIIKLRYPSDRPNKGSNLDYQKGNLQKLKDNLKFTQNEKKKIEELRELKKEELIRLQENKKEIEERHLKLKERTNEMMITALKMKIEKNNINCQTVQMQKTAELLESYNQGKLKPKNGQVLRSELREYQEKNQQLYEILTTKIKEIYPNYAGIVEKMIEI